MVSRALLDASTWVGGFDFTCSSSELSVDITHEDLDSTTFGCRGNKRRGRSRAAGLQDVETELAGYWDSSVDMPVDAAAFAALGGGSRVVTHSVDGEDGSVAYFYSAQAFTYEQGEEVGTVAPYTLDIRASNGKRAVRGLVAKGIGDVSAVGPVGGHLNLGDVTADEELHIALHVLSAGTSLTVDVESSPDALFGTPSVVTTIGSINESGAVLVSVPGPITDTYFRLNVTAVTGTFDFASAIGVL